MLAKAGVLVCDVECAATDDAEPEVTAGVHALTAEFVAARIGVCSDGFVPALGSVAAANGAGGIVKAP